MDEVPHRLKYQEGQEATLAVCVRQEDLEVIHRETVHFPFVPEVSVPRDVPTDSLRVSARLRWDYHPTGAKLERRAIQLGLPGDMLMRCARDWIVGVEDISDFVAEQRAHVLRGDYDQLQTPREAVYPVSDVAVAQKLGLSLVNLAGPPSSQTIPDTK